MFLLFPPLFLWDLIITVLLTLGISVTLGSIAYLYKNCVRKSKVRKCKTWIVGLFTLVTMMCTGAVMYGAFIEPFRITYTHSTLPTSLDEGIRVAVVADFHIRPGKDVVYMREVVAAINAQEPDIVLLPGDFVFDPFVPLDALSELGNISAPLGTLAVLGNHDQGFYLHLNGEGYSQPSNAPEILATLSGAGVRVLRNEVEQFTYGRSSFQVAGIDDLWSYTTNIEAVAENTKSSTYTILMSHNPSIINNPTSRIADLIVSGHTHGGQVRLPFYGPVPTLPTSIDARYDQGVFNLGDNRYLAITRGVGESEARVRFLAPPEVLVLDLE